MTSSPHVMNWQTSSSGSSSSASLNLTRATPRCTSRCNSLATVPFCGPRTKRTSLQSLPTLVSTLCTGTSCSTWLCPPRRAFIRQVSALASTSRTTASTPKKSFRRGSPPTTRTTKPLEGQASATRARFAARSPSTALPAAAASPPACEAAALDAVAFAAGLPAAFAAEPEALAGFCGAFSCGSSGFAPSPKCVSRCLSL
mmetsp:Transcript_63568/g.185871  ORF Transcript_63568/g.185871 Transcript_63568/m.185871 type:complete len:200 (-) Transcript_63568:624-1223(-)